MWAYSHKLPTLAQTHFLHRFVGRLQMLPDGLKRGGTCLARTHVIAGSGQLAIVVHFHPLVLIRCGGSLHARLLVVVRSGQLTCLDVAVWGCLVGFCLEMSLYPFLRAILCDV